MSIHVKDVLNKEVTDPIKLQPQMSLIAPIQSITITATTTTTTSTTVNAAMCESPQSSMDDIVSNDDGVATSALESTATDQNADAQIPLSKKAIHQRDADENLFLRFLELDPPDATPPPPPTPAIDPRRKSTHKSSSKDTPSIAATSSSTQGRTPFTITKKLVRTVDKGFGFSIVWTHPPRIEKIEPGLSADRCGIYPGDYVIFVDKHNVVTMPEMDILNLIRSQGSTLVLEIFRRSGGTSTVGKRRPTSNGITSSVPAEVTVSANHIDEIQPIPKRNSISVGGTSMETVAETLVGQTAAVTATALQPRPSTACSNVSFSLEATKLRLHLPQVTFSKEVGQGVIV